MITMQKLCDSPIKSNTLYLCQLSLTPCNSAFTWLDELLLAEAVEKCSGINDMAVINGRQLSQLMVACYHGNPDYVQDLLEVPEIKVDLQNDEGCHALICACAYGHTQVIQLILNACPNLQQLINLARTDGMTSLMLASNNGHTETVILLLQSGARVNLQENNGWSSLMLASQNGHTETVSLLLQNGAHINMQANDGQSSLMLASQNGHTETVSLLLQNGAHENMQDDDGWSPLMLASQNGHTEIVSLLLQNGANVNMQENDEWTSLMLASQNGHLATVSLLLQSGAHVNMRANHGWSSLMLASEIGDIKLISLLLHYGAHINMQENDGWSSLMIASQNGHKETVALLLQNDARVNMQRNDGVSSLMKASQNGHTETVSLLLQNGAHVNMQENNKWSSLMFASQNGHTETVSLLLQNGAQVDMQREDGWSSLMVACQNGHTETVLLLLQNGAQVDMQRGDGWSSLMIACQNDQTETVSLLLQNGAHVNMQGKDGSSSLMIACQNGHTETVSLLLLSDAHINLQRKDGLSSLMIACQSGCSETVLLLIQNSAYINMQRKDGLSSLMLASQNGHTETVSLLLKNGAHVNLQDKEGWSSLMKASESGHSNVALYLLEFGADPSTVNILGDSALSLAVKGNHLSVVRKLLTSRTFNNEILDRQDDSGNSSLMIASSRGHCELAMILLRAGAKVNISNFSDYSSLHLPPQQIEFPTDCSQASKHQDDWIARYHRDIERAGMLLRLVARQRFRLSVDCGQADKIVGIYQDDIANYRRHTESAATLLRVGARLENFSDYLSFHLPPQQQFPTEVDSIRGSALDIAVIKGNQEMVSLLLKYGAKVHNIYYLFRSIIMKLAQESIQNHVSVISGFFKTRQEHELDANSSLSLCEKYYNIFQLLFSHDSDLINRVQCTKPSILYMACAFRVVEIVQLLLDLGTDVSDLYRMDDSGLSYWSSLIKIISDESLLSAAPSKQASHDIKDLLSEVGWSKNEKILFVLMEKGLDINHKDRLGSFALSIASREGHIELVEWLLKYGRAKVNQQDKNGVSSLMEASAGGCMHISRLLLHYRAMVNLRDKKGWSALMFAVAGGYIDLVVYLLEYGAQVNLQDVCGNSPLMLSCFTGHVRVTKVLLAHNADVNLQNNEGITALMMSSYNGYAEIVELLLQNDADINKVTDIGLMALNFSQNEAISALLKHAGAKPSLGKRTTSMRDSTALLNIEDPHIRQMEEKLQQISRAFLPSSDHNTTYFEQHEIPGLQDAFKLFRDFAYNWEAIGAFLEIPDSIIEEIKCDCDGELIVCFQEMLRIWLKHAFLHPTWNKLKEAVENATHETINVSHRVSRKANLDPSLTSSDIPCKRMREIDLNLPSSPPHKRTRECVREIPSTLLDTQLKVTREIDLDLSSSPPHKRAREIDSDFKDLQNTLMEEKLQKSLQAFVPRPTSDHETTGPFKLDEKPELQDALKLFRDFAYNWEAIGALLRIPSSTMKEVKYDKPEDCLLEMLRIWLKHTSPPPIWRELKDAIETATYGTIYFPHKVTRKINPDLPSASSDIPLMREISQDFALAPYTWEVQG